MLKKLMYVMLAGTMMLATSCEKESGLGSGDAAVVAISVTTPQISTRAYSDGTSATKLQYAVYDKNGNLLPKISRFNENATEIHSSTTVELVLTTGNTYDVIFWAAHPEAPYTPNFETKYDQATMEVDYSKVVCNAEKLDAFYAVKRIKVESKQQETVELKRPFAQINVGTADYLESTNAGYTPVESKVVVSAVSNVLTFADGSVNEARPVTFDFAAIDRTQAFPVAGHEYLAMNYVLVSKDKTTTDVTFAYRDGDGEAYYTHERTIGAVPVQRNYRTNIFGNILTSDVDVNVIINPAYEIPDYDIINSDEVTVHNEAEFTAALASSYCKAIKLGNDIVLTAIAGNTITRDVVIDMNGFTISADRSYLNNKQTTAAISVLVVDNEAKVEFVGEGSILNTGATGGYAVVAYHGDVIIAGNVNTAAYHDAFYVRNGGLYVSGGRHAALSDTNPETTPATDWHKVTDYCHTSTVINCNDDDYMNGYCTVVLTGGTYVNMDPSDVHEGKQHHENFVAEGYKVVSEAQADGSVWFTVVAE